jgi:hypothetical protein
MRWIPEFLQMVGNGRDRIAAALRREELADLVGRHHQPIQRRRHVPPVPRGAVPSTPKRSSSWRASASPFIDWQASAQQSFST